VERPRPCSQRTRTAMRTCKGHGGCWAAARVPCEAPSRDSVLGALPRRAAQAEVVNCLPKLLLRARGWRALTTWTATSAQTRGAGRHRQVTGQQLVHASGQSSFWRLRSDSLHRRSACSVPHAGACGGPGRKTRRRSCRRRRLRSRGLCSALQPEQGVLVGSVRCRLHAHMRSAPRLQIAPGDPAATRDGAVFIVRRAGIERARAGACELLTAPHLLISPPEQVS